MPSLAVTDHTPRSPGRCRLGLGPLADTGAIEQFKGLRHTYYGASSHCMGILVYRDGCAKVTTYGVYYACSKCELDDFLRMAKSAFLLKVTTDESGHHSSVPLPDLRADTRTLREEVDDIFGPPIRRIPPSPPASISRARHA